MGVQGSDVQKTSGLKDTSKTDVNLSEGIFPHFVYRLEPHSTSHLYGVTYADGFFFAVVLSCFWIGMPLKALIIAVGVSVNTVWGEVSSFFPK